MATIPTNSSGHRTWTVEIKPTNVQQILMLQKDTEGLKNKNEMAKNWACDVGGLGHLAAIATAIVVAIAVALAAKRPKKFGHLAAIVTKWPKSRYCNHVANPAMVTKLL